RRHTSSKRDWSSDVCSSDLLAMTGAGSGAASPARQFLPDQPPRSGVSGSGRRVGREAATSILLPLGGKPGEQLVEGLDGLVRARSEERRVGKECRARWWEGR